MTDAQSEMIEDKDAICSTATRHPADDGEQWNKGASHPMPIATIVTATPMMTTQEHTTATVSTTGEKLTFPTRHEVFRTMTSQDGRPGAVSAGTPTVTVQEQASLTNLSCQVIALTLKWYNQGVFH